MFTPTSGCRDYIAAGVGGAISAIPGGPMVSMALGTAAGVLSTAIRDGEHDADEFVNSAIAGAIGNSIGAIASPLVKATGLSIGMDSYFVDAFLDPFASNSIAGVIGSEYNGGIF